MAPRVKVWVIVGDTVKFGEGRAALLEAVEQTGSLQKAVALFGMSYRSAWGYFRELERAAGFKFLDRRRGGGRAARTRLTPRARLFLGRYRRFRANLDGLVARHFERSFRAQSARSAR
jgi:molybdate transport system regulatory protein